MANIALSGANPSYFPKVNDQGLPILDQTALDKVLSRYKSNSINSDQYRDNYNKFGWNVKSDSSYVRHGPAIYGLDMGNVIQGMSGGKPGIVKVGTNQAATDADFKKAAQQAGIDVNNYIKPTKFVPTQGGMGAIEQPNSRNSRQYTDPNTGETYLARIDPKGNFQTTLDQKGLFDQISNQSKDLYLVANALDRTGIGSNKAAPHAAVLFKADGSGNLVPVQKDDGSIAATPYSGVGVVHKGSSFDDLMPILGIGALAFGIPALTSALGGATGALTAGQVGALGAAEGAGLAGMGAGAGLGTGTMAGTMLGTTGATLGTTAGIAAGLGGAGALTGGLPGIVPSGTGTMSGTTLGTSGQILGNTAELAGGLGTGEILNPETGLPTNPNAPGYQIDPEGPAQIGSQCTAFKSSSGILDTAKQAKKLYDAGKSLFGGNQDQSQNLGGLTGGAAAPQFLDSTAEFLNKNPVIAPVAGLKDITKEDLNVDLLGSNNQSGQIMQRQQSDDSEGALGYSTGSTVTKEKTGKDNLSNKDDLSDLIKTWSDSFCSEKLLPKFSKCESPDFLFGKQQSINRGLKPVRQGVRINPLATGGLPHKYAAAAPKGHKPEFITGMTGYYACGAGTGQSDDIPAMLHDGDYVMDAETVSALGDGSSKAGREVLEGFREKIPHKKEGGSNPVPAKIADGEYVFPEAFVTALGGGDNKRGAEILDGLRTKLRAHKRGAPLDKIPPKAKDPLEYIKTGSK